MPTYGGIGHGVERYGGAKPRSQIILASLNEQAGTAFDVSTASPKFYWNLAVARAVAEVWDDNERMSNQFDFAKVTDFLSRWERIFAIYPSQDLTRAERRRILQARWFLFGRRTTHQALIDALTPVLVNVPFTVATNATEDASILWPFAMGPVLNIDAGPAVSVTGNPAGATYDLRVKVTGNGGYGVGVFQYSLDGDATVTSGVSIAATVAIGGTPLTIAFANASFTAGQRYWTQSHPNDWSSTVAEIAIVVPKPSTMSERIYQARVGAAKRTAENVVPAWLEFAFVRDGSHGTGFYLDEDFNLDNQRLSS